MIAVDVGLNAYAFGHYFECGERQDVLMSGYLGSIGFGFPAAMGAWAATGGARQGHRRDRRRRVRPVPGRVHDGGQVREADPARAVDNSELGKIRREQISAIRPVWQTELVNPDFAAYAESCGGRGFRVSTAGELPDVLAEGLAVRDRPALIVVPTAATAV